MSELGRPSCPASSSLSRHPGGTVGDCPEDFSLGCAGLGMKSDRVTVTTTAGREAMRQIRDSQAHPAAPRHCEQTEAIQTKPLQRASVSTASPPSVMSARKWRNLLIWDVNASWGTISVASPKWSTAMVERGRPARKRPRGGSVCIASLCQHFDTYDDIIDAACDASTDRIDQLNAHFYTEDRRC